MPNFVSNKQDFVRIVAEFRLPFQDLFLTAKSLEMVVIIGHIEVQTEMVKKKCANFVSHYLKPNFVSNKPDFVRIVAEFGLPFQDLFLTAKSLEMVFIGRFERQTERGKILCKFRVLLLYLIIIIIIIILLLLLLLLY